MKIICDWTTLVLFDLNNYADGALMCHIVLLHHISLYFIFLYCAAFNLFSLFSGVCHLSSICFPFSLSFSLFMSTAPSFCVFLLAFATIFIQSHKPLSVWRVSGLNRVCRSFFLSRFVPNHHASHCKLSKKGNHSQKQERPMSVHFVS